MLLTNNGFVGNVTWNHEYEVPNYLGNFIFSGPRLLHWVNFYIVALRLISLRERTSIKKICQPASLFIRDRRIAIGQLVIGQFNKPITFVV